MNFQPFNFIANLTYMGEGMFCIIVVMLVIATITMLLNKITTRKKDK